MCTGENLRTFVIRVIVLKLSLNCILDCISFVLAKHRWRAETVFNGLSKIAICVSLQLITPFMKQSHLVLLLPLWL